MLKGEKDSWPSRFAQRHPQLSFSVLAARIAGECWIPHNDRDSFAARLLRRREKHAPLR